MFVLNIYHLYFFPIVLQSPDNDTSYLSDIGNFHITIQYHEQLICQIYYCYE